MSVWPPILHSVNRVLEIAPLLPCVIGYMHRFGLKRPYKILYIYVCLKSVLYIIDVVSRIVINNNIYVFHISTTVSVLTISWVYRVLIVDNIMHKIIILSVFFFLVIVILEIYLLNNLFVDMNSYSQGFGSVFLVGLSLRYIIQISRNELLLEQQPDFFFSVAVLLYFSYTIVTYIASNMIYNTVYDKAASIRLDNIITAPDALLYAVHMGLLAWMFSFFPLSVNPRRALPRWLHYSRWQPRAYKLLGQPLAPTHQPTTTAS